MNAKNDEKILVAETLLKSLHKSLKKAVLHKNYAKNIVFFYAEISLQITMQKT